MKMERKNLSNILHKYVITYFYADSFIFRKLNMMKSVWRFFYTLVYTDISIRNNRENKKKLNMYTHIYRFSFVSIKHANRFFFSKKFNIKRMQKKTSYSVRCFLRVSSYTAPFFHKHVICLKQMYHFLFDEDHYQIFSCLNVAFYICPQKVHLTTDGRNKL